MRSVCLGFITVEGLHSYDLCSFSLQRWSRDKIFSFVPPDGKFILAEYRYAPNLSNLSTLGRISAPSSTSAPLSVAKDNVPIPFGLKTTFDFQEHNGMIKGINYTFIN